jgi:hypothetical protein
MSSEVGTTTLTSAQTLTADYVLADNALNVVVGTAKWFQLYAETETTLEISYTTGAAETSNYLEFYIQFGSGAPSLISWADETVEYYDDSANQILLEQYTYRLDGASAATAYTKRVQLPVCSKGIRIYVKEVGVAANYGAVTIKANTVAAGAGFYNRHLQTVTIEPSADAGVYADDSAFTPGTSYVVSSGFLADETAPDSVNEGDIGIARMTLDRKQIIANELIDDTAFGVTTGYVGVIGALADETAADSVDEGDTGALRMTLDRRLLTAGQSTDDAAPETGTRANIMGALADETASDSVDEGDVGFVRMTLNRRLIGAGNFLDDSAYGVATDYVTPIGGVCDETSTDSVDEGDVGAVRMTADRNLYTNLGYLISGEDQTNNLLGVKQKPVAVSTYCWDIDKSVAYEASSISKAAAGVVREITGYNSKTSAQFIQLHNSATLPADTGVPDVVITVPAGENFYIDFGENGYYCSAGIVVSNSSTGATKTIGSADCWFVVKYK